MLKFANFHDRKEYPMQLSPNHISIESEGHIQQILKPLAKISGIHYFSYGINFEDTSGFTLTTHANYYETAIRKQFPLCGFHLNTGWHLWETTLPIEQQLLSKNLNIGNGILWVKHLQDRTEIIEFAGDADNRQMYDFYMNNKSLLKRFITYFTDEAKELITTATCQKVTPSDNMILRHNLQKPFNIDQSHLNHFLNELESPQHSLSNRELECFLYLIKGYSIAQISSENNLAIPTIANYIHRVKQKLQCFSRKEMVQKATEMGLIEYT
jgi:DNA-binding CsgD family transcriptional regulator